VPQTRSAASTGGPRRNRTPQNGHHPNGTKPTDDELRDRLLESHPDLGFGIGEWRRYEGGIWPVVEELEVKDDVVQVLEEAKAQKIQPTRGLMQSVLEFARVRVAVPSRKWDSDPDLLILENGALNLSTRELLPHSRAHFATTKAPYSYDANARSVAWELVLSDVIAENLGQAAVDFLQEFCGYCLTPDTKHEICLWLTGPRGGGRSTVLEGMRAMLGERAGVLSLSDVARSSFALTNIPGRTLLTATEQPAMFLRGGGLLNALVSGEAIQIDRKFRDPIEITPRAKICWGMNELPRIASADDGLFRRCKILELPSIPPEERDPEVKENVKASGAAILNWALTGLSRLRERGHFQIPDTIESATDSFRKRNDISAMFVEEKCDKDPKFWEVSSYLYDMYKEWCEDTGHKPFSSTRMADEWKRLGFCYKRTKTCVRWEGVKLKNRGASGYQPPEVDPS